MGLDPISEDDQVAQRHVSDLYAAPIQEDAGSKTRGKREFEGRGRPHGNYFKFQDGLSLCPQLRRVGDAKNHRNRDRQDSGEHQSYLLWQIQV